MRMQVLLLTLLFSTLLRADVYLQSCRGSNNRLDEANRERNNGNRLFDSQNNDRGGYNVGKMTWYVGERLPIGWMVQHGCGTDDTSECEVVLQALCDNPGERIIRDGTTTQRIPDNPANCRNFNCDTDMKYGRHESFDYYKNCERTKYNEGLFQASQKRNRGDATRTRQNPGGTRRGYECPEERDYYPYWRPTPFYDIAYWSKKTDRCAEIRAESQNVKSRWHCNIPEYMMINNFGENRNNWIAKIPINQEDCEAIMGNDPDTGNSTQAVWEEVPAHGVPPPECLMSEASRPNHLGLIGHRKQWTMNFRVPDWLTAGQEERACVFRLRYNITEDYDGFELNPSTVKYDTLNPGAMTSQYNANRNGGNANTRPSTWPLWRDYGITDTEVGYDATEGTIQEYNNIDEENYRDWTLRNNPQPQVIPTQGGFRLRLQLAINTAQYGRTFQDRTHVTTIKPRPASINDNTAINTVMVQGKRGNIVQTFPATEYFYQPEVIHAPVNSFIHWAFSGSDTNPNNNDGQGKQGTDRSNAVVLKDSNYDADSDLKTQSGETVVNGQLQYGSLGNSYPAYVTQPKGYALSSVADCRRPDHVAVPMGGIDQTQLEYLATLRQHSDSFTDYGNMEELDDAGTSVNLLTKVTSTGCWNYMGSRNNNFSNRSQKGTLCVDDGEYEQDDVGSGGKVLMSNSGWVNVPAGAISSIQQFTFSTENDEEEVSDQVQIEPEEMGSFLNDGRKVELGMDYEHRSLRTPKLYHKPIGGSEWTEVEDAEFKNQNGKNVCVVWISKGGVYQVQDTVNGGAVAAIVCSGIVFCCAICFMTWWQFFREEPKEGGMLD